MGTYYRGYKLKIYPTEEQKTVLNQFNDLFRYVYNWGIAKEEEIYELYQEGLSDYQFYSFYELCSLFTQLRNMPDNDWLKNIPSTTAKLALRNVVNAYKDFFKNNTNHPKFKSKKKSKFSFNTRNDRFRIKNNCIKIEGIDETISLGFYSELLINENKKSLTKAINPVISKDNLGNYYVSFSLEEESKDLSVPKSEGIGIDIGERRTYILSDGEIYNQPKKKLERLERRRIKQQQQVQRDIDRRMSIAKHTKTKYGDIRKSKRAIKREIALDKTCRRQANIKNTFYDQITNKIVKENPEFVCMETLSVNNMKKNKIVSKLLNTSFYDMVQKMKIKCNQYNIPFIQAPKNFASTKTCSNCGHIKVMKGKHTYRCPNCGMIEDRDVNAAKNLYNYGLKNINNI